MGTSDLSEAQVAIWICYRRQKGAHPIGLSPHPVGSDAVQIDGVRTELDRRTPSWVLGLLYV